MASPKADAVIAKGQQRRVDAAGNTVEALQGTQTQGNGINIGRHAFGTAIRQHGGMDPVQQGGGVAAAEGGLGDADSQGLALLGQLSALVHTECQHGHRARQQQHKYNQNSGRSLHGFTTVFSSK